MMPPGGGAARGDQLAVLAGVCARAADCARRSADDLLGGGEAREADPWRPPISRLMRNAHTRATAMPARSGGGAGAGQLGVREGLARGAAASRFRPGPRRIWRKSLRLVREEAAALAPSARLSALRRADGWLPARRAAADVAPVFAGYEAFLALHCPRPRSGRRNGADPGRARGPVPDRGAGGAVPAIVGAARARFRACAAGSVGASVLRRHARPMCASPRAMTRPTSLRRCWPWCTRRGMRCTSAVCRRTWRASRSARRPAWRRMRASR